MLTVLVVLAGVLLLPAVLDFARRSDLRRVGVRNIVRRLGEASLVVLGCALGTAIIAAAFIVGDTFYKSVRDTARTSLGPVDAVVELQDDGQYDEALALVEASQPLDHVDGILGVRSITASLANADASRAVPNVGISALNFDEARGFGADVSITGLAEAGATPSMEGIVVNTEMQKELGVEIGDRVNVHAFGTALPLMVEAIVPRIGLGGMTDAYVSPQLLASVGSELPQGAALPRGAILLSYDGGVFDSTDPNTEVGRDLALAPLWDKMTAADIEFDVSFVKADRLTAADEDDAEITQIFTVVGGFSVLAGILLLVNLFVMLAEERKPTLGVLRAVGWRRGTLVRAFALEGAIYAVVAAALGAVVGIAVGWVLVQVTRGIFASSESSFEFLLAIEPSSLLQAALIGIVISMVAIWLTSWRISRLNIVRAIRDLPEPQTARSRAFVLFGGLALIVVGLALLVVVGFGGENIYAALVGLPLVLLGFAMLLRRWVRSDLLATLAGFGTVIWGAFLFQILPGSMTSNVDLPVFLVLGVVLVAGGTAIATAFGPSLRRLLDLGSRPATASRLGLAYPVARTFRTAVTLAMFSLIIFSLTFIAVMSSTLGGQQDEIVSEIGAGRDLLISSNASNPIGTDELLAHPDVASAAPVLRRQSEWSASFNPETLVERENYAFSAISPGFASGGVPTLELRDARYKSDQAVFAAIEAGEPIAVVPRWFAYTGDDAARPPMGSTITLHGEEIGDARMFEVVGYIERDWAWAGPWIGASIARDLFGDDIRLARHYVSARGGVAGEDLASALNAAFVTNGADAETFSGRVGRFLSQELGFYDLLAGYLALGLLIGIAGLAVTLVRAVRERRREIGMLRSMGMPASGVRHMFLTEAGFIAFLGVISGIILGLLTSRQVVGDSDAMGAELDFVFPLTALVVILLLPLLAASIASIIPATRAARLRPSEALRLSD